MSESLTFPHGETERWLPVVGWEGFYEVSNLGRVWSVRRMTASGLRGGCMLQPCPSVTGGYPEVALCRYGEPMTRRVHLLVLEAFVGPRPQGMEARHGSNGCSDASVTNLSWGTPKENCDDQIRDGSATIGEQNGCAKLTYAIVSECRTRALAGANQYALAREFGVSQRTMWAALIGLTWRDAEAMPVPVTGMLGESNPRAKLTAADVAEIRRRHAAGEVQRVIARDYGVGRSAIGKIVRGERWTTRP